MVIKIGSQKYEARAEGGRLAIKYDGKWYSEESFALFFPDKYALIK